MATDISLRDWFAGMALNGLLAGQNRAATEVDAATVIDANREEITRLSKLAFAYADVMMRQHRIASTMQ